MSTLAQFRDEEQFREYPSGQEALSAAKEELYSQTGCFYPDDPINMTNLKDLFLPVFKEYMDRNHSHRKAAINERRYDLVNGEWIRREI
jgi:hypothetical protein